VPSALSAGPRGGQGESGSAKKSRFLLSFIHLGRSWSLLRCSRMVWGDIGDLLRKGDFSDSLASLRQRKGTGILLLAWGRGVPEKKRGGGAG